MTDGDLQKVQVQRGPNFSGARASAKGGWVGVERRPALPVGAGSQIPLVCIRRARRPIPAHRHHGRGPLRRPASRTTPLGRRMRKVMRREAHESYGLALELRFDAHREGAMRCSEARPSCGLAIRSSPLRRRLLSGRQARSLRLLILLIGNWIPAGARGDFVR